MILNMSVEAWGANQNGPDKIIDVGLHGGEFRIHLFDGKRHIGHLTAFRGNEPEGDKAKVAIEFVPDMKYTNEHLIDSRKKEATA